MEKICQNIIENEFRFMTPINYVYSGSRKARFIYAETFFLNMNLLRIFFLALWVRVCRNLPSISSTCIAFVFGNVASLHATFVGLLISKLVSWLKCVHGKFGGGRKIICRRSFLCVFCLKSSMIYLLRSLFRYTIIKIDEDIEMFFFCERGCNPL